MRNVIALFFATFLFIIRIKCDTLIVCYYDKNIFYRSDFASFNRTYIEDGVKDCTHLIYGFVGINSKNYAIESIDPHMDVSYPNHYANIVQLKQKYPKLKVLVSVGGNEDVKDPEKYLLLLENEDNMKTFAESAKEFLLSHGFDGLDLAWQFPPTKPKNKRGVWSKIWNGIKSIFTSEMDVIDVKYKRGFANLTLHCKKSFTHHDLKLTMTLLPNVNTTAYVDVLHVKRNVEFFNLLAFDFYTPERNPKEANYPASLYPSSENDPNSNVDHLINLWLRSGAANNKLILGVPAFGRTWTIKEEKYPPFVVKNAAIGGQLLHVPGKMSYVEICMALNEEQTVRKLNKIADPTKRYGVYAYRPADKDGNDGIWIGYDDVDTIENKVNYVKSKGLGGMALYDITLDDYSGICNKNYPLLKAIVKNLN